MHFMSQRISLSASLEYGIRPRTTPYVVVIFDNRTFECGIWNLTFDCFRFVVNGMWNVHYDTVVTHSIHDMEFGILLPNFLLRNIALLWRAPVTCVPAMLRCTATSWIFPDWFCACQRVARSCTLWRESDFCPLCDWTNRKSHNSPSTMMRRGVPALFVLLNVLGFVSRFSTRCRDVAINPVVADETFIVVSAITTSSILYINLSRYVIDVYGFYHYLSFVTSRTSSDSSYFRHVVPFDSIGRSLRASGSSNLSIGYSLFVEKFRGQPPWYYCSNLPVEYRNSVR